jgi:hypothetical protein
MRECVERSEPRSTPDFRGPGFHWIDGKMYQDPWTPNWRPGLEFNTGSGRAAEWCHVAYEQYALICRLLHQHMGWSGDKVRLAGRSLTQAVNGGGHTWQPPEPFVPVTELVRVAALPPAYPGKWEYWSTIEANSNPARTCDPQTLHKLAQWRLWIARVVAPAWGEFILAHYRARLANDPTYRTPSMIVGEIRRLRGAKVTDFRGCSGCQYLARIAFLSTEEQDQLLARAAEPTPVTLANGLQGICVPFGLSAPAEYDRCLILGLSHEIRVRSADYAALTPEQLTAVIRVGV